MAGSHFLSSTSKGSAVSVFQNDAVARSYMVTMLDESIELVNAAIALLNKEQTCMLLSLCSDVHLLLACNRRHILCAQVSALRTLSIILCMNV